MVAVEQLTLDLEHVFGVAHVGHEVRGHLRVRLERVREDLLPRLQDGVLVVPRVEIHGTVVGVDRGLDRVTDVVHTLGRQRSGGALRGLGVLGGVLEHGRRGVRVGRRRGVGVHDPHDLVVHDRRVRVAVHREVGGHLLHPLTRVAVVEDLGLLAHRVREQHVRGLELDGVGQLVEPVAHGGAAVAGERGLGVLGVPVIGLGAVQLKRRVLRGATHDRVLGRVLPEVDPRLVVVGDLTAGRDPGLHELGLAVRLHAGAVRGHHAVAVGVDHRLVVPALDLVRVQFTGRDDRVLGLAVDRVAVHVEHVGELVVRPELLQLGERGGDHVGVQQTDVGGGLRVLAQRTLFGLGRGVVRGDLGVVQTVGLPGHGDVALDVLVLERLLRGGHLEALDGPRVEPTGHHGHDHEHRGTDQGQLPTADEPGHHEQDGHQDGGDRQDALGGDHGVDVGVQRTCPLARVGGQGRVAVQPEVHGLQREERGHDGAQVHAGGTGRGDPAFMDADPAVDVVHEQPGHTGEQQGGDQEADQQPQEREGEHVEAQVQVELGVGLPEGFLVEEQQHGLPLGRDRGGGEQPEDHRDGHHDDLAHGVQRLLVLLHVVADLAGVPGAVAVREPQAQEHERGHDHGGDDEQTDHREVTGDEHPQVAELLEPEDVRVDLGEPHEQGDEDHHRDHRGQQGPVFLAARCGPAGWTWGCGSGGH